jgi:hypothetical protein
MDDQGYRKSTKESGCPYVVNLIDKVESISRIGLVYIVSENKNVSLIPLILMQNVLCSIVACRFMHICPPLLKMPLWNLVEAIRHIFKRR